MDTASITGMLSPSDDDESSLQPRSSVSSKSSTRRFFPSPSLLLPSFRLESNNAAGVTKTGAIVAPVEVDEDELLDGAAADAATQVRMTPLGAIYL